MRVREQVSGAKLAIVVYNGDFTFSGKEDEFQHAMTIVEKIREVVQSSVSPDCALEILVPGNHDCDRNLQDSLRSLAISNPIALESADSTTIDKCLEVQQAYRDFASRLESTTPFNFIAVTSLYSYQTVKLDEVVICLHLLNTAWTSSNVDKQGCVTFPADVRMEIESFSGHADLTLTVMHHPVAWFDQRSRTNIIRQLEKVSDIILTGHEHDHDTYAKKRVDTQSAKDTLYVESYALLDPVYKTPPGFQCVHIDMNNRSGVVVILPILSAFISRGFEVPWGLG